MVEIRLGYSMCSLIQNLFHPVAKMYTEKHWYIKGVAYGRVIKMQGSQLMQAAGDIHTIYSWGEVNHRL